MPCCPDDWHLRLVTDRVTRLRGGPAPEQEILMSSPACADGYDTPAKQREDSTTFMAACLTCLLNDFGPWLASEGSDHGPREWEAPTATTESEPES